jgi:flagellar assembly protein FliH
MNMPNRPGVLRGMPLEREPVSVGRIAQVPGADAAARSDALIAQACSEAREEGWHAGREEGRQRGYEEGLRSGRVDGAREGQEAAQKNVAEALARLDEQQAHLQRLQASVQEVQAQALLAAEDEIVALCFAALCRILGETAVAPETVRVHVGSLLRSSAAGAGAIVRVHPQDLQLLARDPHGEHGYDSVRWLADPEVRLGGFILEQAQGGLDARLETLLESCKNLLLATRAQRQREGVAA